MKKQPFVSVVIPVKELSYLLLHECLPGLQNQTYKKFEIIVLPNESTQYDLTLLRKYKNLRIVPTGSITRPAQKRDLGAKEAKGEILAFLDDDAYPDDDWLKNATSLFSKQKIEAVCGPGTLPKVTNRWEKIFDEVLKTWVGAGGLNYRFTPKKKRFVTDYPSMNFMIKKTVFQKLGGFDNDYWPGEDSKLCNDLIEKEKGKILYSPHVLVFHHRRGDLKGYLRQHGSYGFHRGAFFAHGDENSKNPAYVVPALFMSYLLSLPVILTAGYFSGFLNQYMIIILLFPLALYGIFLLLLLVKSFINTLSLPVSIGSVMTLFLTHMIYGFRFVEGFRKGLDKNASIYD